MSSAEPIWPSQRGSTTDSRALVKHQPLISVRIKHALFSTEEMAKLSLASMLSNEDSGAAKEFGKMAASISNCRYTREKEGEVGWIDVNRVDEEYYALIDVTLSKQIRELIVGAKISLKPGDISLLESRLGVHLVHVVDVMIDTRKSAKIFPRRITNRDLSAVHAKAADRQRYYSIDTMGCQMNQADSERLAGQLEAHGILPLPPQPTIHDAKTNSERRRMKREMKTHQPDVVVVNTCSIREHSVDKFSSHLGPISKRKRNGEDVTIIVAGCVAQQEGEKLLRQVPEIDLVLGPQYSNRLGDFLEDVYNGNQVVATEAAHIFEDVTRPRRGSSVSAWVNIIYGCNERCTYCIVPTVR